MSTASEAAHLEAAMEAAAASAAAEGGGGMEMEMAMEDVELPPLGGAEPNPPPPAAAAAAAPPAAAAGAAAAPVRYVANVNQKVGGCCWFSSFRIYVLTWFV